MQSSIYSHLVRWVCAAWLGAVLLLPASCGTGSGGGTRLVGEQVLGGALQPNPVAYALAQTSDAAAATRGAAGLPSVVDLRRQGLVPPVRNQRWNSCIAWTLGYYVMTGIWAKAVRSYGDGGFLDLSNPENWFSPDYIYSQRDLTVAAREAATNDPICFEPDGQVGCMRPEQALNVLLTKGCAKWSWMCADEASGEYRSCNPDDTSQDDSRVSWELADIGAKRFRPRCYVRFGNLPASREATDRLRNDTCGRMKAWLSEQGTPIAVVVKMMSGWVTYGGENRAAVPISACGATEERGVCLDATGDDLGGQHMMTIIGYDDDYPSREQYPNLPPEKRGSFLFVNQWGTKWGDQGYMWVPYSELAKIWVGGYGLIARDLEAPQVSFGTPMANQGRSAPDDDAGLECAQNPVTGQWVNLSADGNDVPENLNATGTAIEPTAIQLCGLAPCASPDTMVGGEDPADWHYFDVASATKVTLDLGVGSTHPFLRVLVTDEEFRRVGWSDHGVWEGELCTPGRYFVNVYADYPPREWYCNFVSDDPGTPEVEFPECADAGPISYLLSLTLTPIQPAALTDDVICGADVMTDASASGTVDLSGTNSDFSDHWKYTVPSNGELAVVLSSSANGGFSDDVALIVFEGETAESAFPVAWTSPKLPVDYDPANARPAILNLGVRTEGETLYFAAVHWGWEAASFEGPLAYEFQISSPHECPENCVEARAEFDVPDGGALAPKWQKLREWKYELRRGTSYYQFPVDGKREVRVFVEPAGGGAEDCPAGRELRLVAALERVALLDGEVRLLSSRLVPADAGGELTLRVPQLAKLVTQAGSQEKLPPYTAVHVEVHDPGHDSAYASAFATAYPSVHASTHALEYADRYDFEYDAFLADGLDPVAADVAAVAAATAYVRGRANFEAAAGAAEVAATEACATYTLRIEEWGLGTGPPLAFPETFTDENGNGVYDAGEPFIDLDGNGRPDVDLGPDSDAGFQLCYKRNADGSFATDDFGILIEVPCANIRRLRQHYIFRPTLWNGEYLDEQFEDWVLGSNAYRNQPWTSFRSGHASWDAPAIPRRLIMGVTEFCPAFDLQFAGQFTPETPQGLELDDVGSAGNAVFRRLTIPATQPAPNGVVDYYWSPGEGPGDIWIGLRDPRGGPLRDFTIQFWDEVTLTNWREEWRDDKDFEASELSGPTSARALVLDADAIADSVDFANNHDFYSVPIAQDGSVTVDLFDVRLPIGAGNGVFQDCWVEYADVAVWDPVTKTWIRGTAAFDYFCDDPSGDPRNNLRRVVVPVQAGTTLMVLVEREESSFFQGYSRVNYKLQVTSGP